MRFKQVLVGALGALVLASALVLPAAALGEANITADMTMKEIRANESLQQSGILLYEKGWLFPEAECQNANTTLWNYVRGEMSVDTAQGLNLIIENYNAGTQITYKLYTEQEVAEVPARRRSEIYYFPAKSENAKYALVVGGNLMENSAILREGCSTAWQLHELGYAVFVLNYRIWNDAINNAPLEDVGRAVQYITTHAEQFDVQTDNYALVGFSSGAHLAGLFGTKEFGYPQFGVPKPSLLMMGYGVNSFFTLSPTYHMVMDDGCFDQRYYDLVVSDYITPDYPPVYHWYGLNDLSLITLWQPIQGPKLEKALEENGVPHIERVFCNAPHSCSTGRGTDAEGWLLDAVDYWEELTNPALQAEEAAQPGEAV